MLLTEAAPMTTGEVFFVLGFLLFMLFGGAFWMVLILRAAFGRWPWQ